MMLGKQKSLVERGYKKAQIGHLRPNNARYAGQVSAVLESSPALLSLYLSNAKEGNRFALRNDINRNGETCVSSQCCGGVLATVGVVPPLL